MKNAQPLAKLSGFTFIEVIRATWQLPVGSPLDRSDLILDKRAMDRWSEVDIRVDDPLVLFLDYLDQSLHKCFHELSLQLSIPVFNSFCLTVLF